MELESKASNRKGQKRSVWFNSASFCAMRYTNYLWYGDREGLVSGETGASEPIMHFENWRTISRKDFKKHELLRVVVFKKIRVVEELFVEYGVDFLFRKIKHTLFSEESRLEKRRVNLHCRLRANKPRFKYSLNLNGKNHKAFAKWKGWTTFWKLKAEVWPKMPRNEAALQQHISRRKISDSDGESEKDRVLSSWSKYVARSWERSKFLPRYVL